MVFKGINLLGQHFGLLKFKKLRNLRFHLVFFPPRAADEFPRFREFYKSTTAFLVANPRVLANGSAARKARMNSMQHLWMMISVKFWKIDLNKFLPSFR